MIERAANQRWDIKPEYKDALIQQLMFVIADPASSKREKVSASRALIAAEAQNQSDEQRDEQIDEERNRFLDIAEKLGINTTIEQLPEARGNGDNPPASERFN